MSFWYIFKSSDEVIIGRITLIIDLHDFNLLAFASKIKPIF